MCKTITISVYIHYRFYAKIIVTSLTYYKTNTYNL